MKKFLTAGLGLLAVATLAACSNNNSQSEASSSSSSSVSSSTTSASSSSSTTETSSNTEIVLVTDAEIDGAKTIGDMKAIYENLANNYTKYIEDVRTKLPESGREAYDAQVNPAKKVLEDSKKTFNDSLSQLGADTDEIPAEVKESFVTMMKQSRDGMTQILDSVYKMIGN